MTNHQRIVYIIAVLMTMIALLVMVYPYKAHGALMLKMNLPYNTTVKTVDGLVALNVPQTAQKALQVASTTPKVIPAPVQVVEYVKLPDGWECEKPKKTSDILQPSGLWAMDYVHCHKLEMTIEQYRAKGFSKLTK